MDKTTNRAFVKKIETLVKPEDITAISFLGDFNRILPIKTQNAIIKKGAVGIPYMGFIVDPYCFFASYEIKDTEAAKKLLPEGYELEPTAVFANEEKKRCMIVGVFSVRTSAFMGMRMESYLIARHAKTGRIAWIIVDYVTNTNSHDPARGFTGYSGDPVFVSTTPYGELLVEVASKANSSEKISAQVNLSKAKMDSLDYDLWVNGNMTVDYGTKLKDDQSVPFSLIFDPVLMKEAWHLPTEALEHLENSFFPELIDGSRPLSCAVFPYSQHFIIKQDLPTHGISTSDDLNEKAQEFLLAQRFKTMRGEDIKKPIIRSLIVSGIVHYLIIGVLLFLLLR